MNREKANTKYVGMDVHRDCISVAVLDQQGRQAMTSVIATCRDAILDLIGGLRGTIEVTFEETTQAAWLYDLLERRVSKVLVCNPRKNSALKQGNKSDKVDARKLAELLRAGLLSPVYHGQNTTRKLKQLSHAYSTLNEDTTRTMARLKAIYRGQAIGALGKGLYAARQRQEFLARLSEQDGLRQHAQYLFQQLDALRKIRLEARRAFVLESRKFPAVELLRSIPFLGPIRAATIVAWVQTPHRFRTKRQFWSYCGFGLETRSSADYRIVAGQIERRSKPVFVMGLNFHHNPELKNVFKGAATTASARPGPFCQYYQRLLAKGIRPEMARLTVARKLAAMTLTLWKKGDRFNSAKLQPQAA